MCVVKILLWLILISLSAEQAFSVIWLVKAKFYTNSRNERTSNLVVSILSSSIVESINLISYVVTLLKRLSRLEGEENYSENLLILICLN